MSTNSKDGNEKDLPEKNMVPAQASRTLGDLSMSRKNQSQAESGTCNVCSAPCSSCMHRTMDNMGSKSVEYFDESSHVTSNGCNTIDEGRRSNSSQPTFSEASFVCVSSSNDSFSENVESKANVKPYAISDASENHGTHRTIWYKRGVSKGTEIHDDGMLSVSREAVGAHCEKQSHGNGNCCNSALVGSFASEESFRVSSSLPKLDSSQLPFANEATGTNMPKINSQQLHPRDSKFSPENMSEISAKVYLKSETDTENSDEDSTHKVFKCSDDNEVKVNISSDLDPEGEPSLKDSVEDESEESDVMEHDVKVCDICGDAGREDLLAICSKCSDGAEHTYCMREMLQKVPEGDWLCEECKLSDDSDHQKQGSDAEVKEKTNSGSSLQILGKRNAENLVASSAPKRQALEENVKSPKLSSPKSIAGLSRESSSKSLEKGKMLPASQSSSGNQSSNDGTETLRSAPACQRLQASKNKLLKCNSFSTLSLKPKVKLVEDVPQKQKSVGEHNSRLENSRIMGKSKSFKYSSFGRLNVAEPKVKMLSSKGSHIHDFKGIKQVRESTSFDRKTLSKLDRSGSTVSRMKADQKLTVRAEVTSSAINMRESKAMHLDGKRSNLLRSDSFVTRKGIESSAASDQRLDKLSMKDDPSVSSSSTERLSNSFDEALRDMAPHLLEDKTREKQSSCSTKVLLYQRCKEHGHTAEHVSSDTLEASASDVSGSRNVSEDEKKGCKLKAAIEAASRLKPGICARASQDQLVGMKKSNAEAPLEGSFQRQSAINNISQISSKSIDPVSFTINTGSIVMRDSSYASASMPAVFKISAIPEHDYIWMGDFELNSTGKPPILCGGVQAHLSTLASPKVYEVVNKFGKTIVLSEVPRLSTWPTQFHHCGPKDDNIALYFFAKDLESYEKNYSVLSERLIRNDLALKASFDGVELLIFPSTQLPERSQRWNTLFFLWGVFKGSRTKSSDPTSETQTPSPCALSVDKVPESDSSRHADDQSAGNSMIKDEVCKVSPVDENRTMINLNSEIEDSITDTCSEELSSMPKSSKSVQLEVKHDDLLLEQHVEHKCKQADDLGSSRKVGKPNTGEVISSPKIMPVGEIEADVLGRISTEVNLDQVKVGSLVEKVRHENKVNLDEKIDGSNLNNTKRPYFDLSQEEQPVPTGTWSEVTSTFVEMKHAAKKLKTGFGAPYGSYSDEGECDVSYSSLIERRPDEVCEEKIIPEDLGTGGGCMFPLGSQVRSNLRWGENIMQWKEPLLKDGIQRATEVFPNLELGLGAEAISPHKESWPFVLGTADNDKLTKPSTEKREEDLSASLSLSLSFPSASVNSEPIPKPEQLMPETHRVNTSLLLSGSFPDK